MSSTTQTVYSSKQSLYYSKQTFYSLYSSKKPTPSEISDQILNTSASGEADSLEFANLALKDATLVLDRLFDSNDDLERHKFRVHFSAPEGYLRVVFPTCLHEAASAWLVNEYAEWRAAGLVKCEAAKAIDAIPSLRIHNFGGNYSGSVKEPDFSFVPLGPNRVRREFPTVILESGWGSELRDRSNDCRLWHEGSGGLVSVVILVQLYMPDHQNRIRATLSISHCSPGASAESTTTRVDLFPIPSLNRLTPDRLRDGLDVTMGELFGGRCPKGHCPGTVLKLRVGVLRETLLPFIRQLGYQAA
ncbi:hypothetical protein B9Z19DRAFT_1124637 [Tuber borchii]|uniref:Uncharacterized protein n=1 Tax=Tuber borchii TaxID=42251 RepID=A0A2T6ZWI7_TUBBO|nr:hypothetical protein B9Z19DRAFT_1124637 [Tuber borchii]